MFLSESFDFLRILNFENLCFGVEVAPIEGTDRKKIFFVWEVDKTLFRASFYKDESQITKKDLKREEKSHDCL